MTWIDHRGYFGPNRRKARGGVRLRERRGEDYAGRPPCLRTALRQLRMRVIDAYGPSGLDAFIARAKGVVLLADAHKEREVSHMLSSLIAGLTRAGNRDMRQRIYDYIDRIAAKLGAGE